MVNTVKSTLKEKEGIVSYGIFESFIMIYNKQDVYCPFALEIAGFGISFFLHYSLKSERKIGFEVFQEKASFARHYETFPTQTVFVVSN